MLSILATVFLATTAPTDWLSDQLEFFAPLYACMGDQACSEKLSKLYVAEWSHNYREYEHRTNLGLLTPEEAQGQYFCSTNQLCRNAQLMPPLR